MKILCIGSNQESLVCLKRFMEAKLPICGLILGEKKNEKKGSDYKDLSNFAMEFNIPFMQISNINSSEVKEWVKLLKIDIIFILGWSQLIDDEFLKIPNICTVGSHPSKLPYGAGRAPISWSILEELKESAVSFFRATRKADAGNILLQKKFIIPKKCNARKLYDIVSIILANGFIEVYKLFRTNSVIEKKQDCSKRLIRGKRVYEDGFINFSQMKSKSIDLLIRATTDPYPGSFCLYKNKKITIWESDSSNLDKYKGTPGQILCKHEDKILVQCIDKPIWITNLEFYSNDINYDNLTIGSKFDNIISFR